MRMTEEELYENVVLSLARFVEDFRLEFMPDATYINWDAHANISELPQGDLIGLAGVGMAEDETKKYEVVFGVQISTTNDANLDRMTKNISRARGRLVAGTKLQVYGLSANGLEAVEKSWMVAALPLGVTPVQKAEVRAVQAVEVRLLLDPGSTSSLR